MKKRWRVDYYSIYDLGWWTARNAFPVPIDQTFHRWHWSAMWHALTATRLGYPCTVSRNA